MTTIQPENDNTTISSNVPNVIRNEETNTERVLDNYIIDVFKPPLMKILDKLISKNPDSGINKSEILEKLKQSKSTTSRKRKSPTKPSVPKFKKLTVDNYQSAKSKEDLQKSFTMPQLKAILKQNNVAFNGGNKLRHVEFVWGVINPDEAPDPDSPCKRGRRPGSTNKKKKETLKDDDSNESDNDSESADETTVSVHELTYDSETYQVDPNTGDIYSKNDDDCDVIGKWDYETNTPNLF